MVGASTAQALPLPPMPGVCRLAGDALALLQANYDTLLERRRADAQQEQEENRLGKHQYKWQQARLKRHELIKPAWLEGAIRVLDGEGSAADIEPLRHQPMCAVVEFQGKLAALPQFGLAHMARWLVATGGNLAGYWHSTFFRQWLARQDLTRFDLRLLDRALREAGDDNDSVAIGCLIAPWHGAKPQQMLAPGLVWPLFAERHALIEEGLGLRAAVTRDHPLPETGLTLQVLATFPVMPAQWLSRVMELALGDDRQHRAGAQQALARLPDIGQRVAEALGSASQDLRIGASRWLADLGQRDCVPALYQALERERRGTVKAAMLTALEALGEDLSPRLSPAALLAEARQGLTGRAPAGLSWFAMDGLPACRWQDGTPVDAQVLRWWVVLACKLKQPGGNALLLRYLGLLDPASRAALGDAVLRRFIDHDVRAPGQRSAIGEKGILALAACTPGPVAVSLLQDYMRKHQARRAQIEAMLEALADGHDPAMIQLLLGIARRYRTASVQQKARLLAERIAQGKGWSAEQLADRTMPNAGFDDHGRLDLPQGEQMFYVTLDGLLKPVLHQPDGRQINALPALAKEARQQLSSCKRELKQVIAMQTARLHEAMCSGRVWPAQEWREHLLRHPVAGRLVQSLVWIREDASGQTLLRPADDGSLLDAGDGEVTLQDDASLRLAHASLMTPGQIIAWQRHIKDYQVTPLFEQLAHRLPQTSLMTGHSITDREGWLGDTFGLRGAFGKRGYLRGQVEYGSVFTTYYKDFASAGVRVVIAFSGSSLPEEPVAAALKTLAFYRLPQSWSDEAMPLPDVPPVLLAEAYADYHAVAMTCGYDEFWESRTPF